MDSVLHDDTTGGGKGGEMTPHVTYNNKVNVYTLTGQPSFPGGSDGLKYGDPHF